VMPDHEAQDVQHVHKAHKVSGLNITDGRRQQVVRRQHLPVTITIACVSSSPQWPASLEEHHVTTFSTESLLFKNTSSRSWRYRNSLILCFARMLSTSLPAIFLVEIVDSTANPSLLLPHDATTSLA
jgi:hypothetical protein